MQAVTLPPLRRAAHQSHYWVTNYHFIIELPICFTTSDVSVEKKTLGFYSSSLRVNFFRDISIGSFVSASPWDMLEVFFTCTAENISGMFTAVLKHISVFSGKLFNICDHFFEKCLPYFLILTTYFCFRCETSLIEFGSSLSLVTAESHNTNTPSEQFPSISINYNESLTGGHSQWISVLRQIKANAVLYLKWKKMNEN